MPARSVATVVAPEQAFPIPYCALADPRTYVPAFSSRIHAKVWSVTSTVTAPVAEFTTTRTHDQAVSWRADTVHTAEFGAYAAPEFTVASVGNGNAVVWTSGRYVSPAADTHRVCA